MENRENSSTEQDCDVCNKLLKKRTVLKVHCTHNNANNQQSFLCSYCNLPFLKLNQLRKHISKCHGGNQNKSLSSHFQCCRCMRVFPTFLKLIEHDLMSHKESGNDLFCAICVPWIQVTADNIISHYTKVHRKELHLIEKLKKYIIWKNKPRNLFQCTLCFGEWQSLSDFLVHLGTVHEIDTNTHTQSGTELVCEYCGRVFPAVNDIVKHIVRSHWTDPKNACVKCGKDFGSVCAAKTHFRSYHCPVLRQELSDLGVEIKRDMYKEPTKSVQCPQCDTMCKNAGVLKVHMRKHTGDKPFKCDQCDLSFTQIGNFNKHKDCIHGEVKRTTPARECRYPCRECGRKFITRADVKAHERIHTGEKPFSCPHCKRGFTQRGNLNIHLKRWHFGVKQIPLGSTPTFKVNKTNVGSNENGAEFKIFYFTVPVSKKKMDRNNNSCCNNNNNNNSNNNSNSNSAIEQIEAREEQYTGGVFSKFRAEKPRRRIDDSGDMTLHDELTSHELSPLPAEVSTDDLTNNQERLMYLPFNIDMLSGDYCVSSVDDGRSYCSTPTQVINQTVITSITDHHLPRDDDVCNPTNHCLPMYTEVIDHVVSGDSYLQKGDSLHTHHDTLQNNEHRDGNTVVTMPTLETEVFTINDNSNKDLSTMNVEELFRTTIDVPRDTASSLVHVHEDADTMKFLDFSKGTSMMHHSMDCSISNDFHTLNWLHNHSPPLGSHISTKHGLNPIPTVLKNVSGGEIRDLDTLDLSYTRHF